MLLKIELKHYIEALKDAINKKAKRMYTFLNPFLFGILMFLYSLIFVCFL